MSILTITNVLFGDYLITRFKLETRFPKLHRIFKYRNTVKNYSIVLNLIFIYIVVVIMFIYNLLFFLKM